MSGDSRAVQLYHPTTPAVWELITKMAPAFHASRLFAVNSPEQAAMIMLTGHELGFGLSASFQLIHIVEGKPSLSPRGALALVFNSGLLENFALIEQTEKCTVTMARKNGPHFTTSFSVQDARTAGIWKANGGWQRYPANMCRWRAIGFCIDVLFSDVTGGLKRADEYGAEITEAGDVIEMPRQNAPEAELDELSVLVEQYGPEVLMDLNNGTIPFSPDEIRAVKVKLLELGDGVAPVF